ncbi:sortase, partial [Patescibacteria group bacterium]|nr:sortase [Patescibacteria group bacterium]
RPEMFGDLNELEEGDIIEVLQNDAWRRYEVRETRSVTPSDVEAILSDDNQLTLYTCEGSFDQKRLVVYADPI